MQKTALNYFDINRQFIKKEDQLSSFPPPPPNTSKRPAHTNTFVHKLYNMVVDSYFQHLVSWSYSGSSFIVCNITDFSKDVLPKHFKHNNFSSFVRQLNMYGFHKVNKSPRGHRTLAENQIWEFSHAKFLRNRPELLDEIKRKSLEGDIKRENNEAQHSIVMIQASQSELVEQMQNLYQDFTQLIKEMQMMKRVQEEQAKTIKIMSSYITRQNGEAFETNHKTPSIFVTSPQHSLLNNILYPAHDLKGSPSPTVFFSDDELDAANSLYSPNSPHTPNQHNSQNTYCPLGSLSH